MESEAKIEELATQWLRFSNASEHELEDHPDLSAWMTLSELAIDTPESAIEVIHRIIQIGTTDAQRNLLAAGPIEDVLINIQEPWNSPHLEELKVLICKFKSIVWTGRMNSENRSWYETVLHSCK